LFLQGFIIACVKSRTIDELDYHLRGGYNHLTTGRWEQLNNPPLTGTLAAIPLLFVKDTTKFNNFDRVREIDYIQGNKEPFPKKLLLISRLIPLLFMTLLGYFVFLWARELYGVKAGLLALFLCSFSPTILAFGSLVTADIGGALFIFLAMYTFWRYINKPTKKRLIIASVCFGLAQISKMFAVFLIPLFIAYSILAYFYKKKKNFAVSLLVIFTIGLFIINAAYLFNGSFTPLNKYDNFESSTFNSLSKNNLLNWIPLPLPKQYVLGHDLNQWAGKDEKRAFFFMGKVGERFKSYFIVHLLIKTPVGLFIILILGFLYFRRINVSEVYILTYISLVLFMLSFISKLAVGYRHMISIYPLLFLLSGRISKKSIPNIMKLAVGVALIWYMISSLFVFPHHIAYFNEFIGGPKNGYKYTIDSNLDWGQDLDLVKKYIADSKESVLVDPGCKAVTGRLLIPATSLRFQKWVCYNWLIENYEPVDYIGYSWLVYDVKGDWIEKDGRYYFVKNHQS